LITEAEGQRAFPSAASKKAASFSFSFRVQPEKADDTFVSSSSAELRISTQAGSSPRNLGAKAKDELRIKRIRTEIVR